MIKTGVPDDLWLSRWLPLLRRHCDAKTLLELGCGNGRDSVVLAAAGLTVVALDLAPHVIAQAKLNVPAASFFCQNLLQPFPETPTVIGAVVASLSLHYFSWPETCNLVARINATLAVDGVLLCRLNSTNDGHYGAVGHPEIEENFYMVDGEPKRFFDRAAVTRLFDAPWEILSCEEQCIDRYQHPKTVWEIVLLSK